MLQIDQALEAAVGLSGSRVSREKQERQQDAPRPDLRKVVEETGEKPVGEALQVNPLANDVTHDLAMHIGQAETPALVLEGQSLVVDSQLMQ